jgi:hypothetical protein
MNTVAAISSNSRALWYLTRGFGLVALILLTITMVLGLTQAVRFARPGLPRFLVAAVHKNAALLSVAALAVHIATSVLDSYAPIHIVDVFIPFVSRYRPFWVGLGALSVDLFVALVITSLLRERLGHRAWRAVHWTAYACWPIAVLHGLGTGSDTKLGWVLAINAACVAAVLVALWWRLAMGWSVANATRRGAAVLASVALPVAAAAWTISGPLHPGWARRAGTPAALLGPQSPPTSAASTAPAGPSARPWPLPFTSRFEGTQQQTGPDNSGLVTVIIDGAFRGAQSGQLRVVLTGEPVEGGGVQLTGSQVALGPGSSPSEYRGHVTQLQGGTLVAALADGHGVPLTATVQLQLDQSGSAVSGTVEVAA